MSITEQQRSINFLKPYISPRAADAVKEVLYSGYIAEGEEVKLFEQEFGNFYNFDHCVSLNSGTSALELAYELAGIIEGDEVIVPVLTFIGANVALLHHGAHVVFADIHPDTFNLDPVDVARKITAKTKAIVFVHFSGNNAGLEEIQKIAAEHGIPVIEDAAQAVGSSHFGTSEFTAISFQAVKTLTTGDGGMLICKNAEHADKARRLRWFGMNRAKRQATGFSDISEAGYKYHMNNIAAAIGRANLADLPKLIDKRQQVIAAYNALTFDPTYNVEIRAYAWSCMILTDRRDALQAYLQEHGIGTGIYQFRNDTYDIFGGERADLPHMNEWEEKYFFLPLHCDVSTDDVDYIYQTIRSFFASTN